MDLNDLDDGLVVFFQRPLHESERGCKSPESLLRIFFKTEYAKELENYKWYRYEAGRAKELTKFILEYRVCFANPSEYFEMNSGHIADQFLASFSGTARCYSNAHYAEDFCSARKCSPNIWGSLEVGIVIFDEKDIGILWVNDLD